MPQLIAPTARVHTSYLAAMREFAAEGRGGPDDHSVLGHGIAQWGDSWQRPDVFQRYVASVVAAGRRRARGSGEPVPVTSLWYVEGGEFLGRIGVRHWYTRRLWEYGGVVGYDVRPGARRRGHGTAMLRAVLPVAATLGYDEVLVTCDADNVGSRRVIEGAGGVFEDQRGVKLRYWVATGTPLRRATGATPPGRP